MIIRSSAVNSGKIYSSDLISAAADQLSLDYNCCSEDFFRRTNKTVLSKFCYGRRNFRSEPEFFKAATFGNCVVASVSPEMFDFTEDLLNCGEGIRLFDGKGISEMNRELAGYGYTLGMFAQHYLPKTPYNYINRTGYPLRFYEGGDIAELYKYTDFQNALLYDCMGKRRDVLAVCAMNGNTVMGMAGASNDSDKFWQIGVDVRPPFRGKGVAQAVVSALTSEIFLRKAIPYYGTWMGNIASQNVALKCGFYPVWTEVIATPMQ